MDKNKQINKRKCVMVGKGPKVTRKVLGPLHPNIGSILTMDKKSFDDEAKMDQLQLKFGENSDEFCFKAIDPKLNR